MIYAHYYATKKVKFVIFSDDVQGRNIIIKHVVSGKIEAKKLSKSRGAIAWNF
jgi:hypothetical protein